MVAEALRVLGETKDTSQIPVIAKYFDDNRENQTEMTVPKLNGETGNLYMGGLTGNTVADVATTALDNVTYDMEDKGFEAGDVGFGKTQADDIAKNVEAAKAWVAANK